MDFKKEDWVYGGQWAQSALSTCFWNTFGRRFPSLKANGKPLQLKNPLLMLYGHTFTRKSDIDAVNSFVGQAAKEKSLELLDAMEKWVDEVHAECKELSSRDYDSIELGLENLKKSFELIITPWYLFILFDPAIEKELKSVCEAKGYDFEKIIKSIKPLRDSFAVQQFDSALVLYKKINELGIKEKSLNAVKVKSPELVEEIQKHVKKFVFCGVHHFVGEPYSVKKFFENFSLKEQAKEVEFSFPEDINWLVKFASLSMFARTYMAETSGLIAQSMWPFLEKTSSGLGLENKDDYLWFTINELIAAAEGKKQLDKSLIPQRKEKVGVVVDDSGKEVVLVGKELDDVIDKLLAREVSEAKELTGRIACQGKVIGIAKIVVEPKDINKVGEGDILIAPETSPDFVVGMKKAAGVVTELGGITCHAAIVSREFNIPCIVGVKNATIVLKDGDKIEVDANNGVVRKLE